MTGTGANWSLAGCVSSVVLLSLLYAFHRTLPKVVAAEEPYGLTVSLPRDCSATDGFDNRTFVLQILRDGGVKINSTNFTLDGMHKAVKMIYATRYEKVLRVIGDEDAPYGDVITAISLVRAADPTITVLIVDGRVPNAALQACFTSAR